ncbi:patatin-like phospholipase family protein [Endozoicomonas sp. SCSIO W0465]|uniref:patatin-like phospholipase family protein n=1 Tax=Endozoicomonas sp. SCSIO W0465 TaxID=2918516 RepID=UPI002074F5F2|nr:patatin-like phospholipase family protein [Endozoicomonas sp. SCSIO W0465]USE36497.1 patatin-like phospholipase family protein [Endozoicomonas sp. SCSIO W0465]
MGSLIDIQAGAQALDYIRANGLPHESVKVMVGASGGPKWFVLSGLDKALLGEYFRNRTSPLDLIGTSAGSWRFSCYAQDDPLAAHERFEQGYLHTHYSEKPDPAEISRKARELVENIVLPESVGQILNNPVFRFNLIAVRSHGLTASEHKLLQMAGLGLAATGNLINRKHLSSFFTRTLFYHPAYGTSDKPAFYHASDLPTERVRLTETNLVDAILASGSIPAVMQGVKHISGAPAGCYRDGGITDYHFDMRFHQGDGLVLYPHFYPRMIPGWFDKALKHRRPLPQNTDNMVLISPSQAFVDRLPYQKIPDRNDFARFTYDERIRYWKRVVDESKRLGDNFIDLVNNGSIRRYIKAL